MSRKVILYIATSLDGYIADQDGGIDWLDEWADEEDDSYDRFFEGIDTVILGRSTYDQVINELAVDNYPYAEVTSYVMTSRAAESREKVIFSSENVVELVTSLREEVGKDIWLIGGSQVIAPLVEANLIDEYQLTVMPMILGRGISLFQANDSVLSLDLVSATSKNGVLYTHYKKT